MNRSLSDDDVRDLSTRISEIRAASRDRYPGDRPGRQPIHTLYVPADRFSERTAVEYGAEARRLLDAHAPDAASFADAFGVDPDVADAVRSRVMDKLRREPVEDLRIDFEDGYGIRTDGEEDRQAVEAARAVGEARNAGVRPPFFGLRVKSFADGMHVRSVRTLDLFITSLAGSTGEVPDGLIVTFPKVVAPEHVALFSETLARLERALGLGEGALRFEVQVETPQSVVDEHGAVAARGIVEAADGRLTAMHFGVFDYTASLGLMPWEQRLDHPANDFARQTVQVALAGTGVRVSDGSTNVVPASDETEDVRTAWRAHAAHVRHSLSAGFYQGWDLHPSHLPSRYAAVYGWLLPGLDDAIVRVRAWRERAAAAGGVLDEPATVKSLLRFLRFAVTSGAVEEADVLAQAKLTSPDLFGEDVAGGSSRRR
jgi:citrate lyase beta subunit